MPYVIVTVIIDGALDSEETYTDMALLANHIEELRNDSLEDGYERKVYIVRHDHPPTDECGCVEQLQDHSPAHVFTRS